MGKSMFCPKCGAGDQTGESYCKRCGEWLMDLDSLAKPGLFRKKTRDEKIRKMRSLEAVSAGLSLTAAAIIIGIISTGRNIEMLPLAAFCSILVAVYQGVNFYLGYKLQHRIDQSRADNTAELDMPGETQVRELQSAAASRFVDPHSVVDNTTELLESIPRRAKQDD